MRLSASGGEVGSFDIGTVHIGSGSGGGGSWEGISARSAARGSTSCSASTAPGAWGARSIRSNARSSGSAKRSSRSFPKTRISVCTYRDRGDEFVVKGLPLTTSIQDVSNYLSRIRARGGGDLPEAVEEGCTGPARKISFAPARKVILVFGDAPPHRERLQRCLQIATDFRKHEKGSSAR